MTRSIINDLARISLSAALCAAPLSQASEVAPRGATVKVLKVGVMHSQSGDLQAQGLEMRRAADLAVKDFAATHGPSARIELAYVDDGSRVAEAAQQAEKLIKKRDVQAVVGPSFLAGASVSFPLFENAKLPFVLPLARVPGQASGSYTKYLRFEDSGEGAAMADFAVRSLKVKNVVLIHDASSDSSKRFDAGFEKAFRGKGRKVLASLSYTNAVTEAPKILSELIKHKADAVVLSATSMKQARLFLDAAVPAGVHTIFLGSSHWGYVEPEAAGASTTSGPVGHFFAESFAADFPAARSFVEAFRALHGSQPTALAALTYEAVSLLGQAFAASQFRADAVSLQKELSSRRKFQTLSGELKFTKGGSPERRVLVLETTRSAIPRFKEAITPRF